METTPASSLLGTGLLAAGFYRHGPIFMQPCKWAPLLTFCTLDRHPLCLTLFTTLTSVNFQLMLSFYLHVVPCLGFTAMSWAVVPQCGLEPAVPPLPGNLLEMQVLWAQLRPAESETLGGRDQPSVLPSRWLRCKYKFENHRSGDAGGGYWSSLPPPKVFHKPHPTQFMLLEYGNPITSIRAPRKVGKSRYIKNDESKNEEV